jgi:hypothetical protein
MDCTVDGVTAENCTYPFFVSPTTSDPDKFIRNVNFRNVRADHCATLFFYFGDNTEKGTAPPEDRRMSSVSFEGTGHNVGHFPDKSVAGDHEKSAPIVISGGSNVTVRAKIVNDPGFPSPQSPGGGTFYPTGYPAPGGDRVGAGLSGPVGAVVWGWGRNCDIAVDYRGDCDDVVRIQRLRAHGADSYAGDTKPVGAFNFNVRVRFAGVARTAVRSGQWGLKGRLAAADGGRAVLPANAVPRDGEYAGLMMALTDGPEAGRTAKITAYDGRSRTVSFDRFLPAAAGTGFTLGSTFRPSGDNVSGLIEVTGGVLTEAPAHVTAAGLPHLMLRYNGEGGAHENGDLDSVTRRFMHRMRERTE